MVNTFEKIKIVELLMTNNFLHLKGLQLSCIAYNEIELLKLDKGKSSEN